MNSISEIADLLRAVLPPVKDQTLTCEAHKEVEYFAHADLSTYKICAVTTSQETAENRIAIKIDDELAKKFLNGEESTDEWTVGKNAAGELGLLRTAKNKITQNKIDILPIYEVKINQYPEGASLGRLLSEADIALVVDRMAGVIHIHYNGNSIQQPEKTTRLYLTREGDPSYLMCSITINNKTLDKILVANKLKEWPNPISIKLEEGTEDLSIFAQKTLSRVQAFEAKNHD